MKPVMRTLGKDHWDGIGGSLREQQEGTLDIQAVYESGAQENGGTRISNLGVFGRGGRENQRDTIQYI